MWVPFRYEFLILLTTLVLIFNSVRIIEAIVFVYCKYHCVWKRKLTKILNRASRKFHYEEEEEEDQKEKLSFADIVKQSQNSTVQDLTETPD